MKISKHYTKHHVEFDLYAHKMKIQNEASSLVLRNAELLADKVLEPIYHLHPNIISWYRSEALEREYSKFNYMEWCRSLKLQTNAESWKRYLSDKQHVTGSAVTLMYDKEIVKALREMEFDILGVDTYIHVSYSQNNRKMVIEDASLVR